MSNSERRLITDRRRAARGDRRLSDRNEVPPTQGVHCVSCEAGLMSLVSVLVGAQLADAALIYKCAACGSELQIEKPVAHRLIARPTPRTGGDYAAVGGWTVHRPTGGFQTGL